MLMTKNITSIHIVQLISAKMSHKKPAVFDAVLWHGAEARPHATCFESAAQSAAKEMQKTLDAEADPRQKLGEVDDVLVDGSLVLLDGKNGQSQLRVSWTVYHDAGEF